MILKFCLDLRFIILIWERSEKGERGEKEGRRKRFGERRKGRENEVS